MSFGEDCSERKAAEVARIARVPVSQVYDIRREFKRRLRVE